MIVLPFGLHLNALKEFCMECQHVLIFVGQNVSCICMPSEMVVPCAKYCLKLMTLNVKTCVCCSWFVLEVVGSLASAISC